MLNPYNFYNNLHFFYDVGDLMLTTMATEELQYKGEEKTVFNHFGYHVYSDSADCAEDSSELAITVVDYLQLRQEAYNTLREEYLEKGTIATHDYDDVSNVVIGSPYFEDEDLKAKPGRDDSVRDVYDRTKDKYNYN